MVTMDFPAEGVEIRTLVDIVTKRLGIPILYDETIAGKKIILRVPIAVPESALPGILQSALRMKGLALVDAEQPGWKQIVPAANLAALARPTTNPADNVSAITLVIPFAKGSYWNPAGPAIANLGNGGPHGLSEVLYAFTSASENNGSAFAGITVNTPWYDLTLGLCMLFGRFLFVIPTLAIAGSLARKKVVPTSAGTLPTHGPLFVGLLVGTVIVVGALTFFPALSLGAIVEHFLMHQGTLFTMSSVSFPVWS